MPAARSRGRTDDASVKPRPDAYVGLLVLSLVALIAAMVFAYLNWDAVKEKPKPVQMAPIGGGAARTPAGPGSAVAPPPGQVQPGGVPVPGTPVAPGAPGANVPAPPPPQQK